MSQNVINWSKAPSGATHYNPQDQLRPWRAVNGTNVAVYEYGVWRNFVARLDLVALYIPRPIEVQQWDGTGLPPVGIECEYLWIWSSRVEYVRVRVLSHDMGMAQFRVLSGGGINSCRECNQRIENDLPMFRPIITPEQIAAEEREAAIASMLAVDEYDPASALGMMSRHDFCGVLYDLGYRKPGEPTFFGIDYSQDVMTQKADLRAALTELDAAISAARFEDPGHDRIHRALNTARDLLAKIESEKP